MGLSIADQPRDKALDASSSNWIQVDNLVEISTTFPDDIIADDIAEVLVERQLVACAQVSGPIQSTYLWKGKYEQCSEHKLCVKTTLERMSAVVELIRARHPYEVPEITARTYQWMTEDYANWIIQCTANPIEIPESP
jgi:periplasmic divalent cation tolerance protein